MRLTSIAPILPPQSDSERRDAAVLRVHLRGLLSAQKIDGIDVNVIRKFRQRWKSALAAEAPRISRLAFARRPQRLGFRTMLRCFKDAIGSDNYLQSQRHLPTSMQAAPPWTFQTHFSLEYWFDKKLVPYINYAPRLNPTHTARIVLAFDRKHGFIAGATVGRPGGVLWVTSDIRASECRHGGASYLRDALGLHDRRAGEFAWLVQLGDDMKSIAPLRAPTVFDAVGYPRFRPWPPASVTIDPDAGRTYELDPVERARSSASYGRREMVRTARDFIHCTSLVPLGQIGSDADDSPESFEAYADAVEAGSTVVELCAELESI